MRGLIIADRWIGKIIDGQRARGRGFGGLTTAEADRAEELYNEIFGDLDK